VLVPELNTGQLSQLLRAKYLIDIESYSKVQGQPLFAGEIEKLIEERA
jgi:2-oxoglutarate ferredoxin oxidoreductase subunit alpha